MTVWPDYGSPGAPNLDPYYRSPEQVADDEAEHQAATDNLSAALIDAVAEAGKVLTAQEIADALQQAMGRISATRKITKAEVQAACRVLTNWGGLRDTHADAPAIVETMLMRAAAAVVSTTPVVKNTP